MGGNISVWMRPAPKALALQYYSSESDFPGKVNLFQTCSIKDLAPYIKFPINVRYGLLIDANPFNNLQVGWKSEGLCANLNKLDCNDAGAIVTNYVNYPTYGWQFGSILPFGKEEPYADIYGQPVEINKGWRRGSDYGGRGTKYFCDLTAFTLDRTEDIPRERYETFDFSYPDKLKGKFNYIKEGDSGVSVETPSGSYFTSGIVKLTLNKIIDGFGFQLRRYYEHAPGSTNPKGYVDGFPYDYVYRLAIDIGNLINIEVPKGYTIKKIINCIHNTGEEFHGACAYINGNKPESKEIHSDEDNYNQMFNFPRGENDKPWYELVIDYPEPVTKVTLQQSTEANYGGIGHLIVVYDKVAGVTPEVEDTNQPKPTYGAYLVETGWINGDPTLKAKDEAIEEAVKVDDTKTTDDSEEVTPSPTPTPTPTPSEPIGGGSSTIDTSKDNKDSQSGSSSGSSSSNTNQSTQTPTVKDNYNNLNNKGDKSNSDVNSGSVINVDSDAKTTNSQSETQYETNTSTYDRKFALYIDKLGKVGNLGIQLNNFRVSYIKAPNKVAYLQDVGGINVECNLPAYLHVDIVKKAVDLYRIALTGSLVSAQAQQRQQQQEQARNNQREDN